MNRGVQSYEISQKEYFHVPPFKTKSGKASFWYNGASLWHMLLKIRIDIKTSEFQFVNSLKNEISENE